jgi:hypothetical protein
VKGAAEILREAEVGVNAVNVLEGFAQAAR